AMRPDQVYELLRNFTSPIVAVTAERGGKRNGMILDSAVRASIVPTLPRLSVYVHKFNYSHDMIFETGRDGDKLAGIPHRLGVLGAPVLDDCYAHFECRVANVMDTGSSTCFLGDVA